jgi:hypothetical protein
MWALEMEFCREFPAYKLDSVKDEISILIWQRWLVDRASRRMAEDKNNLDEWADDDYYDTAAEAANSGKIELLKGETEEEARIRMFISGGKSGRNS